MILGSLKGTIMWLVVPQNIFVSYLRVVTDRVSSTLIWTTNPLGSCKGGDMAENDLGWTLVM